MIDGTDEVADPTSAIAVAAAVAAGERTVEQVVTAALERVGDDDTHAWVTIDPDVALAQARELDAMDAPKGPLHGVPVGVKDIVDTADLPTRHGSPIYADNRPSRDAAVVARLREAGAVILGKTVTTEFALFTPGPTVNPHDHTRTPGGSSSGSAAAVAAGHVPLAVGTQTAGSVVRPASFCGIVGAKPTIGVVPLDGVKRCSSTLDTVGLLGADVASVALGLGVMAAQPGRFPPPGDGPTRIGFARTPWWGALDPDCATIVEAAAQRLAAHLEVVEVALPEGFEGLVDAQRAVMAGDLLEELAWEIEHHADLLSEPFRAQLDDVRAEAAGRADGLELRDRCRDRLGELFADVDVVLTPSVLGEAPPVTTTGDPMLCRPWTLLGTPAVTVPGLSGPTGLPLGIQIVAPPGGDDLALASAAHLAPLLAG